MTTQSTTPAGALPGVFSLPSPTPERYQRQRALMETLSGNAGTPYGRAAALGLLIRHSGLRLREVAALRVADVAPLIPKPAPRPPLPCLRLNGPEGEQVMLNKQAIRALGELLRHVDRSNPDMPLLQGLSRQQIHADWSEIGAYHGTKITATRLRGDLAEGVFDVTISNDPPGVIAAVMRFSRRQALRLVRRFRHG